MLSQPCHPLDFGLLIQGLHGLSQFQPPEFLVDTWALSRLPKHPVQFTEHLQSNHMGMFFKHSFQSLNSRPFKSGISEDEG